MAKTAKQIEQEILAYLNANQSNLYREAQVGDFPGVDRFLVAVAAAFIQEAKLNLQNEGKVDTGTLENDLAQSDIIQTGDGFELTVGYPAESQGAKYFKYVDQGVQGTRTSLFAPNSPFKYESESPKWDGEFHKAILSWYERNKQFAQRETPRTAQSPLQKKRLSVAKAANEQQRLKSIAWLTARSIMRRGLPETGYFTKAINKVFNQDFVTAISNIMQTNVKLSILNTDGLNNK